MNQIKYTQSTFDTTFDFGNSTDFFTIPESLITATREADFIPNPYFRCSCLHVSPFMDPYSWRRPEEIDDCSRGDIKRAYRLGEWY